MTKENLQFVSDTIRLVKGLKSLTNLQISKSCNLSLKTVNSIMIGCDNVKFSSYEKVLNHLGYYIKIEIESHDNKE